MAWIKFTGAQFRAFMADSWGPAAILEGVTYRVNAEIVEDIDNHDYLDTAVVELKGGVLIRDQYAEGPCPNNVLKAEHFARDWLQRQTDVTVQVSIRREFAKDLAEELRSRGLHPIIIGM